MYNLRLVQKAIRASGEDNKVESNKLFLQGIKFYKEDHKKFQSLSFLKKSILLYPNPRSYYELGNVSLELNFYLAAIRAYKMAEILNYKDISKLYYKLSTAYSLQNNIEESSKYLGFAIDNGYSDIKKIVVDPKLSNLKSTTEYRELVADKLPNQEQRRIALFDLFLAGFPKQCLPYTIDFASAGLFDYSKYIPFDYQELLKNNGITDETKEYSYVSRIESSNRFVTLVYASIEATNDGTPIVEKYLAVFDKSGVLIDKLLFACTCSSESTISGFINNQNEVQITENIRLTKSNPTSSTAMEELIMGETYFYQISDSGKILKVDKKEEGIMARI